jgi:molybdate transport system substrate-binding protein
MIYAQGSLSFLSHKDIDFTKNPHTLANDNIKRIAIANPKTAPYGKATVEFLKNIKIYNKIRQKFIYSESISQTLSYTLIGADVGIIASSALYSPKIKKLKNNLYIKRIDTKFYTPIKQGIVLLKDANKDAKYFYDFILSKEAKKILKEFGYILT